MAGCLTGIWLSHADVHTRIRQKKQPVGKKEHCT